MRITRHGIFAGFGIAALAIAATPAEATLIGDLVFVEYHFPVVGSIFEQESRVVEAGSDDSVTLLESIGTPGNVNVEESSVEIQWAPVIFFPGAFNGIIIRDLDFSGTPGPIVGINIVTDAPGWNDSFASFTGDSLALNFVTLGTVPDGFSMTVDFVTEAQTPEPGGLGLVGFALSLLAIAARRPRNNR
jgi:hypothetical protein